MKKLDSYRFVDACVYQSDFVRRKFTDVMSESETNKILPILVAGTTPKGRMRKNMPYAIGFHPHRAGKISPDNLKKFRSEIMPSAVAIGECGLDYRKIYATRSCQIKVFEEQVKTASKTGLPLLLVVHKSFDDVVNIIDKYPEVWEKTILTDFDWIPEQIEFFIGKGCYISINDAVFDCIYDPLHLVSLMMIPQNKLLFATRSPYSSNYEIEEFENRPSNIETIINSYAAAMMLDKESIRQQSLINSKEIFDLQ